MTIYSMTCYITDRREKELINLTVSLSLGYLLIEGTVRGHHNNYI